MNLQNIFLILFGVLTITNDTFSQKNTETISVEPENSQETLQKRPRSDVHRPARPQMRRPQNSGFGGLLSGKYNVINLCNVVSGFGGDCNERNKRYDMIQTAKHDYLKKYEYIDTLLFFRTTLHQCNTQLRYF